MNELQKLISSDGAFTPPLRILDAIPHSLRTERPEFLPHSIVEELWHIIYWLDYFLARANGEFVQAPATSEEGWKKIDGLSPNEWETTVGRFRDALEAACKIAEEAPENLHRQQASGEQPGEATLTIYEVLTNIAVHNAYHLGRIVELRQVLGLWPPPGGGDRW